jgi:hypothetical protein
MLIERFDIKNKKEAEAEAARKKPLSREKKSKKRPAEAAASSSSSKKPRSTPKDKSLIKKPPQNHPIFGKGGIMWGCIRDGTTLLLDPNFKTKSTTVYGHNGLKVGAWWARVLVALAHGAHGSYPAPSFIILSLTHALSR